jgi:O-antigen/teichoic acid export membrane protein
MHDRFDLAAMADSTTPVFRMIGALFALAFFPTVKGFLMAWAVAEIATWLAYWAMVYRVGTLGDLLRTRVSRKRLSMENPGFWRTMWSTNAQTTLGLASRQFPLLVVGAYAGPAAAGGFRLAHQLASALSKVATLLTRAAFPELVRQLRDRSADGIGRLVARVTAGSALGAGAVMLLVALLGRHLLILIGGEQFAPAYVLLLWLAGGACIELAAVSFEPILQALNRPVAAFVARSAAVLLQLAAMTVLLPALGALGAAISVLLGALFAFIFLGLAMRQRMGAISR